MRSFKAKRPMARVDLEQTWRRRVADARKRQDAAGIDSVLPWALKRFGRGDAAEVGPMPIP